MSECIVKQVVSVPESQEQTVEGPKLLPQKRDLKRVVRRVGQCERYTRTS